MPLRLRRAVRRRLVRALGLPERPWPRTAPTPVPRALVEGEQTGPPGFVGVGAQKCGTSWWHSLLNDHPAVTSSVFKELHFFDRFYATPFGVDDIAAYHALFPAREGELCGEWTPRYMSDPWSVPLLARAAPDTRVFVLLRDPVDRYVSGITHDLARGAPPNPLLASMHMERGDYPAQVRRLYDHFDPSHVQVLQYEACVADPESELARSFEFLGLDPAVASPSYDRQVNTARQEKPSVPDHVLSVLGERYRAQLSELTDLVPGLDPGRWRSLGVQ